LPLCGGLAMRMRVIAIKGPPPKGGPLPTLSYRAQAYESGSVGSPRFWSTGL